jgi:hypothetical protein
VGTTSSRVVGLAAAVLTLAAAFFFGFPAAALGPAVDLGSGVLGVAVFLVAAPFGCSGASVAGWGEVLGLGWSGGSLDNTPTSDDVIPPLAKFHLLGRGPCPLSFRGGRAACGGALSGMLECLLCNSRPRFFPLDIAPVLRSVVSPAATAQRLFSRGTAATGDVEATTRDATGRVPAVTLRVSEAVAALALQWAFWRHVRLHRHSQSAEFDD